MFLRFSSFFYRVLIRIQAVITTRRAGTVYLSISYTSGMLISFILFFIAILKILL